MNDPDVEWFLSRLGAGARSALDAMTEVATVLAAHVAAGRRAWPALALDDREFLAHLAGRLPETGADAAMRAVHASDLWLAAACACGTDGAAAALERTYMHQLDGVLSRGGAEIRDELRQRIREKLLVAARGTAPRIGDYSGRGPLAGWLKVVASRIVVDFLRARDPGPAGEDELLALPSADADPELVHLRLRYKEEFRAAMTEAARALDPRSRTILRLHYIDGLTMEQIAALHRVHRLTAVRWVTEAREGLAATTRRVLLQRFGVGRRELDSIVALMQSRFDLSIRALFKTDGSIAGNER